MKALKKERVMTIEHIKSTAPPSSSVAPVVEKALERAVEWLIGEQCSEGYWKAELEGDTILESEYIILMRFLGNADECKLQKAAAYLREKQMDNGGWPCYPGGPVDASVSVEAYFALKLTGSHPDEPYMVRAREAIQSVGGVPAVNSYTKFYLAMLGQIPWHDTPAVPPEINLLPTWFYFNIYEISSWSRTFVVPLSIIWAQKPVVEVAQHQGIGELLSDVIQRDNVRLKMRRPWFSWCNFFVGVDSIIKSVEKIRFTPLRRMAVRRAEEWMVQHLDHSAGFGAIFPPMVYALIALRVLGYADDSPEVREAREELEALEIEEEDTLRLEPCTSPVWDTAIAVNALNQAGVAADSTSLLDAARWLVSKEVTIRGDWSIKRPDLEVGGWYFEFLNEFYPDIDDTAMVLMALDKCADVPGKQESMQRGLNWLLGMQSSDGGWASFDVDNSREIFNHIPFADHNAMLDPPTADITARILEMLSYFDYTLQDDCVQRAVEFMEREQEDDGSWYGRWGVNYIYGTWQGIRGLTRIGIDTADPMIVDAARWLLSVQNEDGGWGESCESYGTACLKGRGRSTASQTAWALMGLMCAGHTNSEALKKGFEYLTRTQSEDGTWDEEPFTGTGFPRVFYIKYHLYRHSFPTMALGMYAKLRDQETIGQAI
jgi:squalene-hopene/tetraprenyl-beta-curcumene cyclase